MSFKNIQYLFSAEYIFFGRNSPDARKGNKIFSYRDQTSWNIIIRWYYFKANNFQKYLYYYHFPIVLESDLFKNWCVTRSWSTWSLFFHESILGQHCYKLIFLLENIKLFVVCTWSIYITKLLNMSILSHAIIKILRWQNHSVIFLSFFPNY